MAKMKARYHVTILNLINAGILNPGDPAEFEPRKGVVYKGRVEANGDLTFDGRRFHSPSRAATTLAGNSRNGWKEIKVKGRPLMEYRDKLRGRAPGAPSLAPKPATAAPVQRPTPTSLGALIAEHIQGLKDGLAARIASLSAEQFEQLVAAVLERLGYSDVRRVGGPSDRNVDVTAAYGAPFVRVPIRVQVKHRRGAPNVGPTDVAAFRDRAGGPDHVLLMVTNAEFTDGAKETASEAGRQVVHLIDGKELINSMIDKRIGIKEGPMGMLEVDENFWSQI